MKKAKKTKSEAPSLPSLVSFPGRAFSSCRTEIFRAEGRTESGTAYKLRFPAVENENFAAFNLFLRELASAWFRRILALSEKEGVTASSFSLNFQDGGAPSLLLREVTNFQNGEKKRREIQCPLSDLMPEAAQKNTKNRNN